MKRARFKYTEERNVVKKPSGSNSWIKYEAEALARTGELVVTYRITTKHIEDHNITGKDVVTMGELRARRAGQIVDTHCRLKEEKI